MILKFRNSFTVDKINASQPSSIILTIQMIIISLLLNIYILRFMAYEMHSYDLFLLL